MAKYQLFEREILHRLGQGGPQLVISQVKLVGRGGEQKKEEKWREKRKREIKRGGMQRKKEREERERG